MELSVSELAQLAATKVGSASTFLQIGQAYFIRTVTYHYTGTLVGYDDHCLQLADAAWIADSGRFANALKTGELNEVEPYPGQVLVWRQSIVDMAEWNHELPRSVK